LVDTNQLKSEFDKFYNSGKKELELKPIERLMVTELGVQLIATKKGHGSERKYFHPILKQMGQSGHFTVHTIHGKHRDKPMIRRLDYRKFLYPHIEAIIYMTQRG